jgi:transcriptional regulator with XRE-family HTH domain
MEVARVSRPNKPREVYAESYLADRIASERARQRMSLEGLATRMTKAGCAINQSAIYKIEQGQPRRRITVDELVAFSRVFGLPLDDLLTDPVLVRAGQIAPLLEEYWQLRVKFAEAGTEYLRRTTEIMEQVRERAEESGIAKSAIRKYWTEKESISEVARGAMLDYMLPEPGAEDFYDMTARVNAREAKDREAAKKREGGTNGQHQEA